LPHSFELLENQDHKDLLKSSFLELLTYFDDEKQAYIPAKEKDFFNKLEITTIQKLTAPLMK